MTTLIVLAGLVGLLVLLALWLQKRLSSAGAVPRKVLHIGAISTCAAAVYLTPDVHALAWAATAALPLVAVMVIRGWFLDERQGRKSWGMVYFASVYVFLLWTFGSSRPDLVFYPMLLLAIADGLATLAGERARFGHYRWGGDQRSVVGSAVFLVSVLVVLWLPSRLFSAIPPPMDGGWWPALFLALFLAVAEGVSARGRDNLWIPLATTYWLLTIDEAPLEGVSLLTLALVVPVLAFFAYRKKWLSEGGSATACLMGWVLLISPEPRFILPAAVFFLLGTALSLLPQRKKTAKESPRRTKAQVLANGAVPVVLLMVYFITGWVPALIGYFVGFAAALSDTASSELGTRIVGRAYAIFGLRPLAAGSSGGISWAGSLAGVAFALIIPALAWQWHLVSLEGASAMAGMAMAANLTDSALGQAFQLKTLLPDGSWNDGDKGHGGNKIAGLRWMNNDLVNAISAGSFAVLAAALWAL